MDGSTGGASSVRPRGRRRARVLALAVVALLLAAACETSETDRATTRALLDGSRVEVGAAPLVAQVDIDVEADRWARQMRDTCTPGHRPDTTAGVPVGWTLVGENVGVSSRLPGESDAQVLQRLHNAFLASASHRENILRPEFDEVGIGVVEGDCPNVGGDQPELWVVHIFVDRP